MKWIPEFLAQIPFWPNAFDFAGWSNPSIELRVFWVLVVGLKYQIYRMGPNCWKICMYLRTYIIRTFLLWAHQFILMNSFIPIWIIFSIYKQNLIHLLCAIWIFLVEIFPMKWTGGFSENMYYTHINNANYSIVLPGISGKFNHFRTGN